MLCACSLPRSASAPLRALPAPASLARVRPPSTALPQEPLSAIATAELAAEEPRTDVRLVVHLCDGGMRFVEGDARLRRSFVTKLASAIRALAAQPGS